MARAKHSRIERRILADAVEDWLRRRRNAISTSICRACEEPRRAPARYGNLVRERLSHVRLMSGSPRGLIR